MLRATFSLWVLTSATYSRHLRKADADMPAVQIFMAF